MARSRSAAPDPARSDARKIVPAVSIVAPVKDELENLAPLVERVRETFCGLTEWELVLVDDGSTDGSTERMRDLGADDPRVVPVVLDRNYGQTSALRAGFEHARAPVIAMLDADLQNDPADLPAMLDVLAEGPDAVVGYRVNRQDSPVRLLSSRIANGIRNRLTGDRVRDTGCSLKVFRSEAIRSVPLFEGMHRFLPTLLRMNGFEVVEHPVSHHPRSAGDSKYGIRNRALRSFVDLLAVRWMRKRWAPLATARTGDPPSRGR